MQKITIQTNIQAPLAQVWECFTQPNHITQWNFAADTWCCPKATNDFKLKGKFSWRMEAKDGSMGFDFEGEYEQIIPNELVTYSMEDGRKVEITFTQTGNKVTVAETFDAENTNTIEQQRTGWQAILDNFKKHVEATVN